MRVIAGEFRGRTLRAPAGRSVRPTSDALRETLFNVLGPSLDSAWMLDLYAGTGAVGIEALSRGAARAAFVESARAAAAALQANLAALGLEPRARVFVQPVRLALARLEADPEWTAHGAALVFLDPPYVLAREYALTLEALARSGLLRPESLVVAEHAARDAPAARFGRLFRTRELRQGDSVLSFYRCGEDA